MDTTMNDFKKQMNNLNAKASSTAHSAVEKAKHAREELLESNASEELADRVRDYRKRGVEIYNASVDHVRENPITALAIALGVGFVVGLAMRRR